MDESEKPCVNWGSEHPPWGEIFNDQVLATAILDRLLHHSTVINIKGESYRLKEKKKAGLLGTTPKAKETKEKK